MEESQGITVLWRYKHRQISASFQWNAEKFFLIFPHKSWNFISRDKYKTNYRLYKNTLILKNPRKTQIYAEA